MSNEEKVPGVIEDQDAALSEEELDKVSGGAFIEPTIVRVEKPTLTKTPTANTTFENPVIATPTKLQK